MEKNKIFIFFLDSTILLNDKNLLPCSTYIKFKEITNNIISKINNELEYIGLKKNER